MKLVRWVRFEWDLKGLPETGPALESCYRLRPAVRAEQAAVRDALFSAFALDSDWNDTLFSMRAMFELQVTRTFEDRQLPCLLLTSGARVVGASILSFDPQEANHLVSGPAILNEYRNRGLGAALLYQSLAALRAAGLERAFGLTKANVPTAKFLYSKYDSIQSPVDLESDLLRSAS